MAKSIFHKVLEMTVNSNSSDLHVKENSPVAFRISGEMLSSDFVPDHDMLMKFINEMVEFEDQMETFKKTGDLDMSHVEDGVGRFRVNVHRQRGLISMTLRHVKNEIMTFKELGLPPVMKDIAESHRGIIILSGTTGSGKSTTMAAMLEHININFRKHIITIEDPIEYEFADNLCFIEQREVGLDTESFQSALKHVLRQDPDIIMVGEMRDKSSFEAALQAADTGHLVMTTLHSSNASQTINRILDFYDKGEQDAIREALALNLRAIISQRLIPKAFGDGRIPGNEIMINTPMVNKLLMEDRLDKLPSAISAGIQDGMMSFNQRLLDLVNSGQITEEDALENSDNPEQLKMNFQGIFLGQDSAIVG
jgi:twitching motility protein PilT